MSDLTHLKAALARVTVRGSLSKLICPKFRIAENPDGSVDLVPQISVPDATWAAGGTGFFQDLESRHPLTAFQVERCSRDVHFCAKQARAALLRALEHELDESLYLDDTLFNPPEHWGVQLSLGDNRTSMDPCLSGCHLSQVDRRR